MVFKSQSPLWGLQVSAYKCDTQNLNAIGFQDLTNSQRDILDLPWHSRLQEAQLVPVLRRIVQ